MNCNFVSFAMRFLHSGIIAVFVRDEESCLNVAPIGVLAFSIKDIFVQLNVVVVNGIVESNGDHHRNIFGR